MNAQFYKVGLPNLKVWATGVALAAYTMFVVAVVIGPLAQGLAPAPVSQELLALQTPAVSVPSSPAVEIKVNGEEGIGRGRQSEEPAA